MLAFFNQFKRKLFSINASLETATKYSKLLEKKEVVSKKNVLIAYRKRNFQKPNFTHLEIVHFKPPKKGFWLKVCGLFHLYFIYILLQLQECLSKNYNFILIVQIKTPPFAQIAYALCERKMVLQLLDARVRVHNLDSNKAVVFSEMSFCCYEQAPSRSLIKIRQ